MQDTAAVILRNIKKGVKFAEFALEAEPQYPSRGCLENIRTIFNGLPRLAEVVASDEPGSIGIRLASLRENLQQATTELERESTGDARARHKLVEGLVRSKLGLRESLVALVKGLREDGGIPAFSPCPDGGIYAIDTTYAVHCTRHPEILPGSKVRVTPATDPRWIPSLLSLVILYDLCERDEGLNTCLYYYQARVLEEVFTVTGEPGRFRIPSNANLDQMVQIGKLDFEIVDPEGPEKLSVVSRGEQGRVACNEHPSLVDLHELVLNQGGIVYRPFEHVQTTP
jgi:hypothetical protein